MNSEKKYRSFLKIKMAAYFSIMVLLISLISVTFFYKKMVDKTYEDTIVSLEGKAEALSEIYDFLISTLDQISLGFCTDSEFDRILSQDSLSFADFSYVEALLNNAFSTNQFVSSVTLYLPSSKTAIDEEFFIPGDIQNNVALEDFISETHYKNLREEKKHRAVFSDYADFSQGALNFYYCRDFIRIKDQSTQAIMKVCLNGRFYNDIVKNSIAEIGQSLCMLGMFNELKEPILLSDLAYFESNKDAVEQLIHQSDENNDFVDNENGYLQLVKQKNKMSYVMIVSETVLQEQINNIALQSIGLRAVIIVFFVFITILIVERITRPIVELAEQMQQVDMEHDVYVVEARNNDEIGYLTTQFNVMVQKIETLIQDKYISRINENNARMQALQNQINPHFLYNSLQVISTEAMLHDDWEVVAMINSLSDTYRYVVKTGDVVTVAQEKINVENFLKIHKYRYGEQLNYQLFISEEAQEVILPKFTLQILAENAIKHGMGADTLELELGVEQDKDTVSIYAKDNGNGFEEAKAKELQLRITQNKGADTEAHGLGLKNLYDRFAAMYGAEKIELSFSTVQKETMVQLRIRL